MDSTRFLQLAPPPRPVPIPLICRTLLGIGGRMGSLFLGFGMVFVLVFGPRPAEELQLALSGATARGTVSTASPTNTSVNDVTVWRYDFTFRAADGQQYAAHSYSTGQSFGAGDRVLIEYATARPESARIESTRLSAAPYWAMALMLGFPIFGAVLVIGGAIRGVRQASLLQYGNLTTGRVLSTQSETVAIEGVPVLRHDYEFLASDGQTYYGSARTLYSGLIGDEPQEPILYDAANPSRSMLIDSLPLGYNLEVDGYGQWATHEGWRSIAWCAFAAVGLAVLAGYVAVNLAVLL
jgi:hypothetical protein